jgi:cation transport ATPase
VRRHHHRPPLKLQPAHRRWLYLSSVLLLVSGAGWLVGHYFLHGPEDFPGAPNPSEPWWLRVHGAAAMGFLLAFGALWPQHMRSGWRQHINRPSGIGMLVVVGVLTLTAYGLYYVGGDRARGFISIAHWTVGLVASAGLPVHVMLGRRLNEEPRRRARNHGPISG